MIYIRFLCHAIVVCPHLMTTAAGKSHAVVFILGVTKGYLEDNFKVKIERIAI